MDWTAGKPPIFVLFMFSVSRSRKRKEKKMQNGNSKVEIEMEKGLPSECLNFQFMCAQMQAIKETYNVQYQTLQIDR